MNRRSGTVPPLPKPGELELEARRARRRPPRRPRRPRQPSWLAKLGYGAGLVVLAFIALLAGAFTAIATTLPKLDSNYAVNAAANSVLLASNGKPIATLTGERNRLLVTDKDVSPNLTKAVVGIEDKRFYQDKGIDLRGVARALYQDFTKGGASQGASTLSEQFVKNALAAEHNRTLGEKVREALLARDLEQRWSKPEIMTHYLNTAYFGNGAYGVESAVRTYFGQGKPSVNPSDRLAHNVTVAQAALLAGMIANPTAFDPAQHPGAARGRRDQVLREMLSQHSISDQEYGAALREPLPAAQDIHPPKTDSTEPYFSSWVAQQLSDTYGPARAYGGGLQVKTSLDPDLQQAADTVVNRDMRGVGPQAALVAIDNKSGEVRALVGGPDFEKQPFNLATAAHRQPGSTFKAFTLVEAMREGISPQETFVSAPKTLRVPGGPPFVVHNDENQYTGPNTTLAQATALSDNSVFAELGLRIGPPKLAQTAQQMGVSTPVSANPATTLGGLQEGLTPLEMAYAYSTIANGGRRVSGTLASATRGPSGIESVSQPGRPPEQNQPRTESVYDSRVAGQLRSLLQGVVAQGTGQKAQLGSFAAGKTGTTENYYDAWFVGFNDTYTVAVWVGYPDGSRSMRRDYHGNPLTGSTYPTELWHDFMAQAIALKGAPSTPSTTSAPTTTTTTQTQRTQSTPTVRSTPSTQTHSQTTATTPKTSSNPSPQQTQPSGGDPGSSSPSDSSPLP